MNNPMPMIILLFAALFMATYVWLINHEKNKSFNKGKISAYQEVIGMCEGAFPLRLPDDVKRIDFEAHCVPFNYKR